MTPLQELEGVAFTQKIMALNIQTCVIIKAGGAPTVQRWFMMVSGGLEVERQICASSMKLFLIRLCIFIFSMLYSHFC